MARNGPNSHFDRPPPSASEHGHTPNTIERGELRRIASERLMVDIYDVESRARTSPAPETVRTLPRRPPNGQRRATAGAAGEPTVELPRAQSSRSRVAYRQLSGAPFDGADPTPRPPTRRPKRSHHPMANRFRWTYCLVVGVLAFLLWFLAYAPTLQHNAQTSPLGTRRTVALDILGPVAALSRGLQVSHVVSVADGLIGRTGNGVGRENGVFISKGPAPSHARGGSARASKGAAPSPTPTSAPNGSAASLAAWQRPTAASPLRVLVIGDSLGIDLGETLVNDLSSTGVVSPTLDGVESTGLARPDYYNWPGELQADLGKLNPQLVVIMLGANDPQGIPTATGSVSYGTPQWDQTYRQHVSAFMAQASSQGAKVVWVGMPPMENGGLSNEMAHLDQIYAAAAAQNPNVTFISSWTLLGTPQGGYAAYVQSGGQEVNVREPDGTHISPGGGQVLSQAVMATMRNQLHIQLPG